jgi:metal-dependent amidase/aminoacylase/carboxypeptidase family protein
MFIEAMEAQGETISPVPVSGRASSDFGNFSHIIPGAHPYFSISDTKIGAHSAQFKECANSPKGLENMVKAAISLAYTACCFLNDKEFRESVKADFLQ